MHICVASGHWHPKHRRHSKVQIKSESKRVLFSSLVVGCSAWGSQLRDSASVPSLQSFLVITGSGCHWAWHRASGRSSSGARWDRRRLTAGAAFYFLMLLSLSHTHVSFFFLVLFFAHSLCWPFLEILQRPRILAWTVDAPRIFSLHVDLLASPPRFDLPSSASAAPGGCQRWLKGLPGGFKGPFNPSSRS